MGAEPAEVDPSEDLLEDTLYYPEPWEFCFGDGPNCAEWLLAGAAEAPNHICDAVASHSVVSFGDHRVMRTQHKGGPRIATAPLPLTRSASADYAARLASVRAQVWSAAPWWSAEPPKVHDDEYPAVLVDDHRPLWACCVVSHCYTVQDGVQRGTSGDLSDLPVEDFGPMTVTWSHVVAVAELPTPDPSEGPMPFVVRPTEIVVLMDGPHWEKLLRATREAERWVRKVLLGREVSLQLPGRPPGTGGFATREQFVGTCLRAVHATGVPPSLVTQKRLRLAMGHVLGGVEVSRETFRDWRKRQFGFRTWADLRDHLYNVVRVEPRGSGVQDA